MNAVAKLKQAEETNFADWIREAIEEAGGITSTAADILANRVLADRVVLEQRLPEIVKSWAFMRIGGAMSASRNGTGPIITLVQPARIDGSSMRAAALDESIRFMNRTVWGGKPVAHCTVEDLLESADNFEKHARSMSRNAAWQTAVAALLKKKGKPGDRVCDRLTEEAIAKLWEKIDDE